MLSNKATLNQVLESEEDYGVILEALENFSKQAVSLAVSLERQASSLRESGKLGLEETITDVDFCERVEKNIDHTKVLEKVAKVRDRLVLLKAKVVMTKEFLKDLRLAEEIEQITK